MPPSRSSPRIRSNQKQHRFVTYNVLSSHLAEPDHFRKCDREHLDAQYRMNLIKEALQAEMDKGSIIALQEVGRVWGAELYVFFADHGYSFVWEEYGSKFNDYMGVGMAVPQGTYDILQVNNKRIADTFWHKRAPKKHWLVAFFLGWMNFVIKLICGYLLQFAITLKLVNKPYDAIHEAMQRWNILVSMKLKHKKTGDTFWTSTYHMPCAFNNPDMMTLHASLTLQYLQRLSGAAAPPPKEGQEAKEVVPYVLLGDFNFKPEDGQYSLYLEGTLDPTHRAYPCIPENLKCGGGSYKVNCMPVRSAYNDFDGVEPEYTNNAIVTWGGKEQPHFKETIDYIFVSPEWKVTDVLSLDHLPTKEEQDKPFPSEEEPSDHVMIAAEMTLTQ